MGLIRFMLALAALTGMLAPDALAQTYPSRSIRLVVPFPAGGTADAIGRVLGQAVGQALGQSIVVDNRAGGDGAVAALLVKGAAPDGYTLFLASNSAMSAVPTMHRNPPYDPRTDFTAVNLVGKFTFFLFVNPAVPAKTLTEFIDYARANPGKLNYGSGNTTGIVTMAQLSLLAKLDMTHIPYKGDAPTTADLIAGRVHIAMMATSPGFALAKEGKLRILATLLPTRSAMAPDVPTMGEAGMPGVSVQPWLGLFAPARLPPEITARVSREFNAALRRPEVVDALARQGFEAQGSTPAELATHVREQIDAWAKVIREAKIPVE